MKKLQQLFGTIILTLVLSASTFAGDGIIIIWVTEPTPTPAPVMATTNEAEDDGLILPWLTANDSATEVVRSLLPSVLALF